MSQQFLQILFPKKNIIKQIKYLWNVLQSVQGHLFSSDQLHLFNFLAFCCAFFNFLEWTFLIIGEFYLNKISSCIYYCLLFAFITEELHRAYLLKVERLGLKILSEERLSEHNHRFNHLNFSFLLEIITYSSTWNLFLNENWI